MRPDTDVALPDALRSELGRPFGPVFQTPDIAPALAGAKRVMAVGDVVSLTLKALGVTPQLFICDLKTQRGEPNPAFEIELGSWGQVAFEVKNPAGIITKQAWQAVATALLCPVHPVRILVHGEEDLLGLVCFAEADLGDVVVYGLPGQGAVVATVTPELKARVAAMVQQLTAV